MNKFIIEQHDEMNKEFSIIVPSKLSIEIIVDYDDVDHEKVDAEAIAIVEILNKYTGEIYAKISKY